MSSIIGGLGVLVNFTQVSGLARGRPPLAAVMRSRHAQPALAVVPRPPACNSAFDDVDGESAE
ncbi:MAG: hypothetical protein L0J17_07825 [Brevibacterium sp.]|uniref:hypothetical protein n=1 Tax=Brevibacterium sp. TaxID=1701 RepID=UPI0026494DE6|nr:hypothetical protein [Brevibacterium sp.]MDN5807462.1 hypothetical protein [Brevibacterium sp.]MDN5875679.1 hypothetical protein [Brevibacterium sp.]MDN6134908.1 hypothetical protein [Brevibacterium sp.]MDN6159484.1 hypothetical protein [Brevibacterium sp.]MDN6175286.1 hypothetical protein [Brevibacterium sp.]